MFIVGVFSVFFFFLASMVKLESMSHLLISLKTRRIMTRMSEMIETEIGKETEAERGTENETGNFIYRHNRCSLQVFF